MLGLEFVRRHRKLTQTQLSRLTKIAQPIISLIESGRCNPTPTELDALARVLGISPPSRLMEKLSDLTEDIPNPEPPTPEPPDLRAAEMKVQQ